MLRWCCTVARIHVNRLEEPQPGNSPSVLTSSLHEAERRGSNRLTLFALQRRMRTQLEQVYVRASYELERLRL